MARYVAAMICGFAGVPAIACTLDHSSVSLGSESSFVVGTTVQRGSGASGLECDVTLAALATHYVGLTVDASTFQLEGPAGQKINFEVALSENGAALTTGNFYNLSSISVLSLFSGTGNSVPIYVRTIPKPGLGAGIYRGSIAIRWHYSVCSFGLIACVTHSSSPGFVRPFLFTPLNWGTGSVVNVDVELTLENDCMISAPNINFGAAPLVGKFNPVTQTISIRCSAGTAYTVGLDNGGNAEGSVRRMHNGGHYLRYEIYKSATSPDRWGRQGTERRSSDSAEVNPGTYDAVVAQGFGYRAQILIDQQTPPAGAYADTVTIDVSF